MGFRKSFDLSVYFVADPSLCAGRDVVEVVREALRGGVSMVQYRDKNSSANAGAHINSNLANNNPKSKPCPKPAPSVVHYVKLIQEECKKCNVPLLINDYVELAQEIDADGVHLGQGDMAAAAARKILGEDKIIGLTAFAEAHIKAADPAIVDYIGTGPFFETQTDKGKPVLGAQAFETLIAHSRVPVVGIGGITAKNAREVMEAGADGVAMMRAISEAESPEQAAYEILNAVAAARLLEAS